MITVKIKENSKQAKAVIEFLKTCDFVEVVSQATVKARKPRLTKLDVLINKSEKQIKDRKTTTIKTNDIWGSLGLK